MRPLLRYDNEMCVRHAISMNQVANSLEWERVTDASAETLCDEHDALCNVIRQIGKVIDVCFRDDETFTGRCWLQRHECNDDIVLVYEACRSLLRNDLTENTTHTLSIPHRGAGSSSGQRA